MSNPTSKKSTIYKIVLRDMTSWKPWSRSEMVLDTTDDLGHARYLAKEYKFIYNTPNWQVVYEKV